jgi:hypothetical protein
LDKQIINWLRILLPPKCFKKLYPIFLDTELNRNELEVNKWEIEINKLMEYEYKNDIWIIDVMKAIWTGKRQYKDITLAECEIWNNWLYY